MSVDFNRTKYYINKVVYDNTGKYVSVSDICDLSIHKYTQEELYCMVVMGYVEIVNLAGIQDINGGGTPVFADVADMWTVCTDSVKGITILSYGSLDAKRLNYNSKDCIFKSIDSELYVWFYGHAFIIYLNRLDNFADFSRIFIDAYPKITEGRHTTSIEFSFTTGVSIAIRSDGIIHTSGMGYKPDCYKYDGRIERSIYLRRLMFK